MRKLSLLLLFLVAVFTNSIAATKTVYFKNTANWPNVAIWVWDGSTNTNYTGGSWPGIKIVENGTTLTTGKKTDGSSFSNVTCATENGLLKITIEVGTSDKPSIIFNNNNKGDQTANLTLVDGRSYTRDSKDSDYIVEGEDPVFTEFYVRGENFGGSTWPVLEENKFNTTDGKNYTLTLPELEGPFKVSTDNWNINYGGAIIDKNGSFQATKNSSANCNAKVKFTDVTISFSYTDGASSITLNINGTVEGGEHGGEDDEFTDLYLRGDNFSWSALEENKFNTTDGKNYSITLDELSGNFKITGSSYEIEFGGVEINGNGTFSVSKNPGNLYLPAGYHFRNVTLSFEYSGTNTIQLHVDGIYEPINPTPIPEVEGLSGTLPVMFITTDECMTDKDYLAKDKHNGTYYIAVPESCTWGRDYAIGSADEPLAMTIKLRGNYTRSGFSKKPYKLKLGEKASLMGLSNSKDYALLAHADDDKGFMRNFVGFELGKLIGLPWTPSQQPVEVVINGEYRGLYFLTESISVESGRVNINKLSDGETDSKLLSGGYLVELDNYREDSSIQLSMPEKSFVGGHAVGDLLVTFNTPEELSDVARQFLTEQFSTMNNLVGQNSNDLWKYMDLDDAVRYYLVMELISHWEAYHGSTYMFRDRGEGQKWHFSPLWDCGNAFGCSTNNYFYNQDQFGNTWIPSLRANGKFNAKLKETWQWFLTNGYSQIMDKIDEYATLIDAAAKADADRWEGTPTPNPTIDPVNGNQTNPTSVMVNRDVIGRASWVKGQLSAKVNWLKNQSDFGPLPATPATEPDRDTTPAAELPGYVKPEQGNDDPDEPTADYYIFFKNDKGWTPYVWAWNDTENCTAAGAGNWPGDPMKVYDAANNIYIWEAPAGKVPTQVIISNNGGTKAGNGDLDYVNKATYSSDGTYSGGEIVYPVPTGMSGTLPVMYITTDACLIDKDYLEKENHDATLYIAIPEGCQWGTDYAIGSADAPLTLQMKLRGNYTRSGFSKKPYKLKLDSKASLMGLSKSKHFALIAHADDDKGFMRNFVGFELGKQIGLPWAPSQQPVEVVINGVYRGLYFLTESIRIEKDRVNITEIEDGETNPALLSGGYLVELDNYMEDSSIQLQMPEKSCVGRTGQLLVTFDTPEVLSATARKFLQEQFSKMNDLVGQNSDDLWKYMDLDDAVRYYLVMELLNHGEAYHGSTYMYRDFGFDQKWHFSPLWDCGHAFEGDYRNFLYNQEGLYGNTWIPSLRANGKFNAKLKETWRWFLTNCYDEIMDKIDNYANIIDAAAKADAKVWENTPTPTPTIDPVNGNQTNPTSVMVNKDVLSYKAGYVKDFLRNKVNWLKTQTDFGSLDGGPWTEPTRDTTPAADVPDYVSPDYVAPEPIYVYVANANAKWNPNNNSDFQVLAYFYNDDSDEYTSWPNSPALEYNDQLSYTMSGKEYVGFYVIQIPDDYRNGRLIIHTKNGNNGRYPADGKPGMQLDGKNVFYVAGEDHLSDIEEPITEWSGTLPVLFIDITDGVDVPADQTKVSANYYVLDTNGTKTDAKPLSIKGRGTSTWTEFEKKPYKLKLDKKYTLGGLPTSKHFVLMPYAHDCANGLLANTIGHELSRIAGLEWAPSEAPVELVLNGKYQGLYFVVENVRPAAERVQIQDYADLADGVYDMQHDWLIEVDNTVGDDVYSYEWIYGNTTSAHIVPAAPDFNDPTEIAAEHYDTLKGYFDANVEQLINAVQYASLYQRSTDWMDIIDADEAARYIVVQELMDDANACNTSMFMHHTTGGKWMFGPVWDFSGAFASQGNKQEILHSESSQSAFFRQLFNNIPFRDKVIEHFTRISGMDVETVNPADPEANNGVVIMADEEAPLNNIYRHIDAQAAKIGAAAEADAIRWPQYAATEAGNTVADRADKIKEMLQSNAAYLATEWNSGTTGVGNVTVDGSAAAEAQYYDMMGRRVANPAAGNIYIVRRGVTVTKELVK